MTTDSDAFSDFFYAAPDGLKLHARIYGEDIADRLPVVCLPGLTRNVRDFHELALYLSRAAPMPRKVVSFDYRGRGQSAYDLDWQRYTVAIEAGDIVQGLAALGIDGAAFIGTSRGGLIIHVLAMLKPALLKAVVLNDIGPVVDTAGLMHIRSYLERAPKPQSVAEAVEIQRGIHGAAFSALSDMDWTRMVGALYRVENGSPVPDFDPALLNGLIAFDPATPLPILWPQFEMLGKVPMLAIRGENSLLLSAQTLAEMARRHPDIETITVEGQGHAPLLETGDLPQRIAAFIDRVEARR